MKTRTNHGAEIALTTAKSEAVAQQQACSAHEWTIDDVWAGRLICKPPGPCGAGEGWFAKWCYKIGWHTRSETSKDHYTMIAMSDGMIHAPRTKEAILEWLKAEKMVPMREEWWHDACHWMRGTLGFVQNAMRELPPPSSSASTQDAFGGDEGDSQTSGLLEEKITPSLPSSILSSTVGDGKQ